MKINCTLEWTIFSGHKYLTSLLSDKIEESKYKLFLKMGFLAEYEETSSLHKRLGRTGKRSGFFIQKKWKQKFLHPLELLLLVSSGLSSSLNCPHRMGIFSWFNIYMKSADVMSWRKGPLEAVLAKLFRLSKTVSNNLHPERCWVVKKVVQLSKTLFRLKN